MRLVKAEFVRRFLIGFGGLVLTLSLVAAVFLERRYRTADSMEIPVKEFSNVEYPEDPSNRSVDFGRYADRKLKLVKRDETHFDFIFEPMNRHTATVVFKNIDVGLLTPTAPQWTKADSGLEKIAFVDRQWNRQQVSFKRDSGHIQVSGGNGFEKEHLYSAELAKNCLNAGLWEILLFTQEGGQKALYYQGWFDFPLGHYKRIFELQNSISYWKHWWRLEHWVDPAGTRVPLEGLREVVSEETVLADIRAEESIFAVGEQRRKTKTLQTKNLVVWRDVIEPGEIQFAAFIPPGRYSLKHLRNNEYWRLNKFQKAIVRQVHSQGADRLLHEIELVFEPKGKNDLTRFIVSGIDLNEIPRVPAGDYPNAFYMPMGIGVPPFFQSYEELQKRPSYRSTYFSLMLDSQGRWLNHHDIAIDGPVMRRDIDNPNRLHVCLLSYERHTLVTHYVLDLPATRPPLAGGRKDKQSGGAG